VSVSILKGVIVKSELLPRFSSANIKISVAMELISGRHLTLKAYDFYCKWKTILEGAEIAINAVQWPVAFQHTSVGDCFQRIHLEC